MGKSLKDLTGRSDQSFQPTSEPLIMTAYTGATSTFIAEMAQFFRHFQRGAIAAAFSGGVLVGWLIAHNLKTRLYAGTEKKQQKASEDKANKKAISRWEGEGGAISSTKKGIKK